MKLERLHFDGELRTLVKRPYKSKTGEDRVAYDVGIELPTGALGQLSCDEKFGKAIEAKQFKKGDSGVFVATYDSDAKYFPFQVVDLIKK